MDDSNARFTGVILAAGRSTRFGPGREKPLVDLAGRSVLQWSVDGLRAHDAVREIVVVLPPGRADGAKAPLLERVDRRVVGGETRAHSALAGASAAAHPYVLVHDAARPAVSPDLVERVARATVAHGAAIPVLRPTDTVKRVTGGGRIAETLDRDTLGLAQTPQGARRDWLVPALEAAVAGAAAPTDEAAALERAGRSVHCVQGDPDNEKITTPEDLRRMRGRLAPPAGVTRVGTGFDVHRFGKGRRLVLGGVEFPGEDGLEGHSDADVALHAAMDAVLGAAAMGDIGSRFPPDDPRFAGADSRSLAREVAGAVRDAGFRIVNLDVTLLAERPRLAPRVEAMRASIAGCFGIAPARVGVKATTLEGLGALGRGEGIACQASASLAEECA